MTIVDKHKKRLYPKQPKNEFAISPSSSPKDKQKKVEECFHGDTIWGDICLDCGHRQTKPPISPKDYLTDRVEAFRKKAMTIWDIPTIDQKGIEAFLTETITQSMEVGISQERERLLKEVSEKVKELHKESETKSSEHECSQEGYEYGLEDTLKALSDIGGKGK